jgi:hypothetical protein
MTTTIAGGKTQYFYGFGGMWDRIDSIFPPGNFTSVPELNLHIFITHVYSSGSVESMPISVLKVGSYSIMIKAKL